MMSEPVPDEVSVFLNVPFDTAYESNFVALVASIVALGRKPRCVLELPELGEGRLSRLFRHLELCQVSIHDLSRVGAPARFNMPFELGLACALSTYKGKHHYVLFEKEPYRLDRTLSDLKGRDPLIHGGKPEGVVNCVLDVLANDTRTPDLQRIHGLRKYLWRYACGLKREHGRSNLFHRSIFEKLVGAGTELANRENLIPT
jgi:hypothetical protein